MNASVFSMITQVLQDSREKTAAAKAESKGVEKTAAQTAPALPADESTPEAFLKVAEACEFLAENLHVVVDDRSPQEKLAELVATQDLLHKMAEGESDPPMTPSLDDGVAPGGPGSAIKTEPSADGGGGESLDAGESGEATPANVTPKDTTPTEKPNPQDAGNAMNTNKEMMQPDQPEDILKQAQAINPEYVAELDQMVRDGQVTKEAALEHLASEVELVKKAQQYAPEKVELAKALLEKAAEAGAPPDLALSMIRAQGDDEVTKIAEDALLPATISGGTEPALQSSPGVPSALNQGSEPGENTPRETAPTSGQGSGRDALSSNDAAISLTKGTAKGPQKSALSEVLTEPALSAAHDKVLQKSLDNTSSAGVKISAAKELLRKFAAQSPANATLVGTLSKMAEDGELPEEAPAAEEAPPMEAAPEMPAGPEEAPPAEAIEAAAAGITPEMLEQATMLLQAQEAQAAEAEEAMAAEQAAAAQAAPAEGMPQGVPPEAMAPEGAAPEAPKAGMMPGASNPPPSAQGAM
jgi:hypothetical protein